MTLSNMENPELTQFVNNWLEKADSYRSTDLCSVFDRFFSLFVPFNTLYQEAANHLIAQQRIKAQSATDSQSATKHVVTLIGASQLKDCLIEKCQSDINEVVTLIEDGTFYINTHRGSGLPDHATDKEQIRNIRSGDAEKYCLGILQLIYKTRCNMFHGGKGFHHIQLQILRPMNAILLVVIECLRTAVADA